jgi:hypothetical protein
MSSFLGLDTFASALARPFVGPDWSAPQAGDPASAVDPAAQGFGDFTQGIAQEGLAGLFDISGMLDRQDAQRRLAGQFDVRSQEDIPQVTGENPGNMVTPEQFQDIARTYSDIRTGRSDIQLDTSGIKDPKAQAAFRENTMGDIGNLLQTDIGRTLVNDLAYQQSDHKTTIKQNMTRKGRPDTSNAFGGADPNSTAPAGAFANGAGMDAEVQYVPGDAGGIVNRKSTESWMPMRSDITLFHELAHAYHATIGDFQPGTVSNEGHPRDVGEGMAEYQAVGLGYYDEDRLTENTYRKERAQIGAGVGARTTGGVADANVTQRTRYTW